MASGIQFVSVLVVLSSILKYESVYPEGSVQEALAVVPGEGQEAVTFVGEGMFSMHCAEFEPPFTPLQIQVQFGGAGLAVLLTSVPALQLK